MNKRFANRRIAFQALDSDRRRRGFAKVDMGGGSGRLGSRKERAPLLNKGQALKPTIEQV
jgi:hypothetical protein